MAVARGALIGIGLLGLFTGVAMVSDLVCSNGLLGRPRVVDLSSIT